MVKRFVSIAAVLALFSTVALAQEGQASATVDGPENVAVQAGPGPGEMPGFGQHFFEARTIGPMGDSNVMWFHHGRFGQWWRNPELVEKIGLNDQQKQQLEKISQADKLKMIDLRADLEKQQVILEPMLQAYHPDENQVLAQVEKVSQARAAIETERVQSMLASRNVLSEEQWNKLKDSRMTFHRSFRGRDVHRHMGPQIPDTPPSK